jgi:3-oxoacyl-(acyl-carrier-protein) synthase
VASDLGARGPSANYVQGELAAAHALRAAWLDLREGRADAAVVFACDSLPHPSTWLAYEARGLLSTRPPERALCPFDRDRDGVVLGEGAAAVVLETVGHARARGVVPAAELIDVHVAMPDHPEIWSVEAAALTALLRGPAAASVEEAAFVVARGLGTVDHDRHEANALARALPASLPVTAVKGATGYLGAATGLVETVCAMRALAGGVVPPVAHLSVPDPACTFALARVPVPLDAVAPRAIVLCAGWSGERAAIVVGRPPATPVPVP